MMKIDGFPIYLCFDDYILRITEVIDWYIVVTGGEARLIMKPKVTDKGVLVRLSHLLGRARHDRTKKLDKHVNAWLEAVGPDYIVVSVRDFVITNDRVLIRQKDTENYFNWAKRIREG